MQNYRIEMLDADGSVVETYAAHRCVGDDGCQYAAVCEDHGGVASAANPVYVWNTSDDMLFAACGEALRVDNFARLKISE